MRDIRCTVAEGYTTATRSHSNYNAGNLQMLQVISNSSLQRQCAVATSTTSSSSSYSSHYNRNISTTNSSSSMSSLFGLNSSGNTSIKSPITACQGLSEDGRPSNQFVIPRGGHKNVYSKDLDRMQISQEAAAAAPQRKQQQKTAKSPSSNSSFPAEDIFEEKKIQPTPPTHSKGSKSMDQTAMNQHSKGNQIFHSKAINGYPSPVNNFLFSDINVPHNHQQHYHQVQPAASQCVQQTSHAIANNYPQHHQKGQSWCLSNERVREMKENLKDWKHPGGQGAMNQLTVVPAIQPQLQPYESEQTRTQKERLSGKGQRSQQQMVRGNQNIWAVFGKQIDSDKVRGEDKENPPRMNTCGVVESDEHTVIMHSQVNEEGSYYYGGGGCKIDSIEHVVNVSDIQKSSFDLDSFVRGGRSVEYSKVVEGLEEVEDSNSEVIEGLRKRLSAAEDENHLLRGQLIKLEEMSGLRSKDFENQLMQSRLHAKEAMDQLERRIAGMKITHSERLEALQKEITALSGHRRKEESDAADDNLKLIECLTDMIASFSPQESGKPSVKQIWKWLKNMLGEYMGLKKAEAKRKQQATVIESIKIILGSNINQFDDDEAAVSLVTRVKRMNEDNKQLIEENAQMKKTLLESNLKVTLEQPSLRKRLPGTLPPRIHEGSSC